MPRPALSVSLQVTGAAEHPDRQLEASMQAEAALAEEHPAPAATDDTSARIACLTDLLRQPVVPPIDQPAAVHPSAQNTHPTAALVSLREHASSCQPHPCPLQPVTLLHRRPLQFMCACECSLPWW